MSEKKEGKIQSFTDLRTWQKGHAFVLDIYRVTKQFPRDEIFGLISQLRRAAVSFTSNIAEGFRRKSPKEKVQFYAIAFGSLTEIQNQLLVAKDVGYLPESEFKVLATETVELSKMLSGLMKSVQ